MTVFNPFPTAPSTGDFSPAALTVLSQKYLNFSNTGSLVINDCVISAMAKSFGMVEANSGRSPVIYQDTNILKAYENYCNEGKTLPAGLARSEDLCP